MWQKISLTTLLLMMIFISSCDNKQAKTTQGYIEGRYTYIGSSISGHLQERFVDRGQKVKSGEKLAVLDPMPQAAELKQERKNLLAETEKLNDLKKGSRTTILESIKAEISQAQSDLELADITLKRYRKLYKTGAVPKERYDQALTDYKVKQKRIEKLKSDLSEAELGARVNIIGEQTARIEAIKANIEKLEWQLSQKTMYSPVDGIVFDTFFRKGEFVPAGQPVLALLAPKNVYLIFFLPEALLSSIKDGEIVYFSCDGCSTKQSAKVYFISPNAEYTPPIIYTNKSRQKLVYRIEARIPLDKALQFHPGQPVDVILPEQANGK